MSFAENSWLKGVATNVRAIFQPSLKIKPKRNAHGWVTANPTILVPFRQYSVGCSPTAIAVTTKIEKPGSLPGICRSPSPLLSVNLPIPGSGPLTKDLLPKAPFWGKPEFVDRIPVIVKFYSHEGIEPALVVKIS